MLGMDGWSAGTLQVQRTSWKFPHQTVTEKVEEERKLAELKEG